MPFLDGELCPTCHSRVDSTGETRAKGEKEELPANTPVSSNTGEIPQWTDDPCLTANGFNGDNFKGRDAMRDPHIREIQEARKQEEIDAGIIEESRTEFTDIDDQQHIRKTHIIELRESTEKILDAAGRTLLEYFNLDPEENEIDPNPRDPEGTGLFDPNIATEGQGKEEWTDVERGLEYINGEGEKTTEFTLPSGEVVFSPTIPNDIRVRAIHIEDLRHPLPLGWREFWSITETKVFIDMPIDFTSRETISQTFLRNVPAVNAPTLFPGGSLTSEELTILATPQGFGNKLVDLPDNDFGPQDIITTRIAGVEGVKGFPSGFDIHDSDGGNEYLFDFVDINNAEPSYGTKTVDPESGKATYDIEKAWIIEGRIITNVGSLVGSAIYSAGGFCPFENEVEGSSTSDSFSTVKAEIINEVDELVVKGRADAKTLRLSINATTNHSADGVGVGAGPLADAWVAVRHIWAFDQTLDPIFGYPISLLLAQPNPGSYDPWTSQKQDDLASIADRTLRVAFNTHFKFFADYVREGDTDLYGIPTEGPTDVQIYIDRVINFEKSALGITSPVNANFGTLLFGNTSTEPPSIFRPTPAGFSGDDLVRINHTLGICLLVLELDGNPLIAKLILSDIPTGTESFISVQSGNFGGQSFSYVKPPNGNNDSIFTVFLGSGDAGKYDESINIDDLLVGWSKVPGSGFAYTSHKEQVEGDTVENPDGTPVTFSWVSFYLGARCESEFNAGAVVGNDDFPDCTIQINNSFVTNHAAVAHIDLSAIRIESNNKKLEDLPENE